MDIEGSGALVVGGASGLGEATARRLHQQGAELTIADEQLSTAIGEATEGSTLLGRAATLEDVANVAAFVASDQARTMTAATVNVSAGALLD